MKATGANDKVGKVFLVRRSARMCVICGSVFTREDAAKHAQAPCNPSTGIPQGEDK
jgi:hypothetical protein